MKKFILFLLFALMLNIPICAYAYSTEAEERIASQSNASELESEYLTPEEKNGDKTVNIFQKALNIIIDTVNGNKKGVFKSFGAIMAVLILCCVMHSMNFGGEGLETAVGFISVLALSGVTYSVLYNLFVFVIASMEALNLALTTLMPIMATLNAFGGTVAAGAASSAGLTVFLTVLSTICTKIILPFLQISFALSLSGVMPGSVNLSAVNNLVKNFSTTLMAFIFTLLGFVLYLQTAVAAASDNFFTRSVRFASGVFVPVIGGILGDASRTVLSSVGVIKGTVGASGVVIILSAVLPPFILVVVYKLLLLACAVAAKSLGCDRESMLLYELGGILNVVMALVAGAGAVAVIAMAVFVRLGLTV